MNTKRKLLAAVTASGAILWLTVSADSRVDKSSIEATDNAAEPLSLRVESLREKLRSSLPVHGKDAKEEKIENVVQFFNFYNCYKPGWRNC